MDRTLSVSLAQMYESVPRFSFATSPNPMINLVPHIPKPALIIDPNIPPSLSKIITSVYIHIY